MKKTIPVLLLLFVFLTGCDSNSNNANNNTPSTAPLGGSLSEPASELSDFYNEKVYEDTDYKASFKISETFIDSDNYPFDFSALADYGLNNLKSDIEDYIQSQGKECDDYIYGDDLSYMTGSTTDGDISAVCIYGEESNYCFSLILETNSFFSETDLNIIAETLETFSFDVFSNSNGPFASSSSADQGGFIEESELYTYNNNGIAYSFNLSKSFELFDNSSENDGMIFTTDDYLFWFQVHCFNGNYSSLDEFYENSSYHSWPVTEDKGEFNDNNGRLVRYYLIEYLPSTSAGIYQLEFVDNGCGYVLYLSSKSDIPQNAIEFMNELVNEKDNFKTVVSSSNDNTSNTTVSSSNDNTSNTTVSSSNDSNSNTTNNTSGSDVHLPEIPSDSIRIAGTNAYFYYPSGMGGFDEEITVDGLAFSEQTAGAQIAIFSNETLQSFAGTNFDYEMDNYFKTINAQTSADILYSGTTEINGMDAFYVCYALDEGSFYSYHADFIIDSGLGSNPVFLAEISTSIDYFFDTDYDVLAGVADYFHPIY